MKIIFSNSPHLRVCIRELLVPPFFLIVCFTSYFVFSMAVLPHSPGVVYYHLLLRRETRIPGVAPFSFRIGIWDLFVHRGQKSYTPTAFGKLLTTQGVRCMKHQCSKLRVHTAPGAHISVDGRTIFWTVRPVCARFFNELWLYIRGVHGQAPGARFMNQCAMLHASS